MGRNRNGVAMATGGQSIPPRFNCLCPHRHTATTRAPRQPYSHRFPGMARKNCIKEKPAINICVTLLSKCFTNPQLRRHTVSCIGNDNKETKWFTADQGYLISGGAFWISQQRLATPQNIYFYCHCQASIGIAPISKNVAVSKVKINTMTHMLIIFKKNRAQDPRIWLQCNLKAIIHTT